MVLASHRPCGLVDDHGRVRQSSRATRDGSKLLMTLHRYLLLPGLYAKQHSLRISEAVLSVFVVALLTAGYSFTALLCFACRNEMFQAEGVFL